MVWRRLLLLLILLLMVGKEKMVPPYLLTDIYTIFQDLLPSCQRIINIQLHLIHASVGPPSTPTHRYLACIEPTGCCGDNGTLRFELRLSSTADAMPPKRRRRRLARTLDIDPGAINIFVAASPPIVADPECTCWCACSSSSIHRADLACWLEFDGVGRRRYIEVEVK
jgi:hypothetical protein